MTGIRYKDRPGEMSIISNREGEYLLVYTEEVESKKRTPHRDWSIGGMSMTEHSGRGSLMWLKGL